MKLKSLKTALLSLEQEYDIGLNTDSSHKTMHDRAMLISTAYQRHDSDFQKVIDGIDAFLDIQLLLEELEKSEAIFESIKIEMNTQKRRKSETSF